MKECPECNAINNDNACLCFKCGASFNEVKLTNSNNIHKCKHCGRVIDSNDLCDKCKSSKTVLKITLYILACIIAAVITTYLKTCGILLGALPTIIMWLILSTIAHAIADNYYDSLKDTPINDSNTNYSYNTTQKPINNNEIKIDENTFQKEFKIVGVTFENRQTNLKQIHSAMLSKQQIKVGIRKYLYEGNSAFKIYANGLDIGNISKNDIHHFLDDNLTFKPIKIHINYFNNEYNDIIYYARITIEFKNKITQETKKNINDNLNKVILIEHIHLLSSEEQDICLRARYYIDEDKENKIDDFKNFFADVEKPIHVTLDDTIQLRVPKHCKGKYICEFDFESARKKLIDTLPAKYNDKHLINILSLSLTIEHCFFKDFLHFNRIAIIDTIIYTTTLYVINLMMDDNDQNISFTDLSLSISEVIEYLFDVDENLVIAMFCTRFDEYTEFVGRKDSIVLLMSILTKHIEYLYECKSFSFSKFPYIEMKKEDKQYLIEQIKTLTDNILILNKE